jgi:RNA polymerase sigma-70 factor (ECF subfamily)
MSEHEWLAERFEARRAYLRTVAYRILGSMSEAEDAVQESWLRLSRSDAGSIENFGGWLTTVVARVCLDMLRSRASRREEPLDPMMSRVDAAGPEQEALLADSVGLALFVILETLAPAERVAFVLHDLFAVPFDEIAPIVGRSPTAARQLASRARRRVHSLHSTAAIPDAARSRQREVVEAFLAASRGGDFEALLAVLDPDVVVRADRAAAPAGTPREIHGATAAAEQALKYAHRAPFARLALVDGAVGIILAPRGRLVLVLAFKFTGEKVAEIDVIASPERLRQLDLALLDG